jgi:hypothetical protein
MFALVPDIFSVISIIPASLGYLQTKLFVPRQYAFEMVPGFVTTL